MKLEGLTRRVDAAIDNALGKKIVGMVLVVLKDGETIYRRAAGLIDREADLQSPGAAIGRIGVGRNGRRLHGLPRSGPHRWRQRPQAGDRGGGDPEPDRRCADDRPARRSFRFHQRNRPRSRRPWPASEQWGGIYGHNWFIDPAHRLSVVSMSNTGLEGCSGPYREEVRDAIYGATA